MDNMEVVETGADRSRKAKKLTPFELEDTRSCFAPLAGQRLVLIDQDRDFAPGN